MGFSGKTAKISSIVAVICIVTYIAMIVFGAVRIVRDMGERRNLAESEFYDLADRATSSSVFLGFMSEVYQEAIRDFLNNSRTLSGVIITGTSGEYAFERQPGDTIIWTTGSPRFRTGLGFSSEPFYMPLRIEGQRNVTIQAIYSRLDYYLFQRTLRDILLVVLTALVIAFLTLLLELYLKSKTVREQSGAYAEPVVPSVKKPAAAKLRAAKSSGYADADPDEGKAPPLYSPRGNISWESYTGDRLASELHRCASVEQDLALLAMEFRDAEIISDDDYSRFADEAVRFFTMRDLVFCKGKNGIAVIMPNTDLEQGISQAKEFRGRIIAKLPESFEKRTELCVGLSSRSSRLVDADRLMLEAFSALEKALADPFSYVIAFKSDPEKYREFIKNRR